MRVAGHFQKGEWTSRKSRKRVTDTDDSPVLCWANYGRSGEQSVLMWLRTRFLTLRNKLSSFQLKKKKIKWWVQQTSPHHWGLFCPSLRLGLSISEPPLGPDHSLLKSLTSAWCSHRLLPYPLPGRWNSIACPSSQLWFVSHPLPSLSPLFILYPNTLSHPLPHSQTCHKPQHPTQTQIPNVTWL